MTTPTDPTTLRTALEALVQKWSDEAISAMSNGLTEQAVATEWCASDLRAALATPAPAADEARCAFVGCGGVRDDVYHEPCLPGGVFHDHKACHPFQPDPTPVPPTPPATGTVAALVEGNVYRLERVYHEDGSYSILPVPLAAARAEVDVEALAEALDRLPYRDCEMWVNNDIPTAGFAHDLADAYLAARARRAGEELG